MSKTEHASMQKFYAVVESTSADGPYRIIGAAGVVTEKTIRFPQGLNGHIVVRKSNLKTWHIASSPLNAAKLFLAKHEKRVQRYVAKLDEAKKRLRQAAELQAFVEKTIKEV